MVFAELGHGSSNGLRSLDGCRYWCVVPCDSWIGTEGTEGWDESIRTGCVVASFCRHPEERVPVSTLASEFLLEDAVRSLERFVCSLDLSDRVVCFDGDFRYLNLGLGAMSSELCRCKILAGVVDDMLWWSCVDTSGELRSMLPQHQICRFR